MLRVISENSRIRCTFNQSLEVLIWGTHIDPPPLGRRETLPQRCYMCGCHQKKYFVLAWPDIFMTIWNFGSFSHNEAALNPVIQNFKVAKPYLQSTWKELIQIFFVDQQASWNVQKTRFSSQQTFLIFSNFNFLNFEKSIFSSSKKYHFRKSNFKDSQKTIMPNFKQALKRCIRVN